MSPPFFSAKNSIVCLMGPTAAGKTALAITLTQQFPCEIISVDSAMIYRGLDIGTAKPDRETLEKTPHHLINICDPHESYSAGQFRKDALTIIADIISRNKIPLLVGGTMLYFHALQKGLASLPPADPTIRAQLSARAMQHGWENLHAELQQIDPTAAAHIHSNDSQRIQRALEVYLLTGKPISTWQQEDTYPLANYSILNIALCPTDRASLHEKIAKRFMQMLTDGFIDEVKILAARHDLSANLPAIRAVGYRQAWAYLAGEISYAEMINKAIATTRQLAKRQITWLRSWPDMHWIDADAVNATQQAIALINLLNNC